MAKQAGRLVKLYKGTVGAGTLVAGGREHGISINNEPIDITDKGDDGWRTLLDVASVRSVDISFSGLLDGTTMIADTLNSDSSVLLDDYYVEVAGLGTISGTWFFNSVELGTPHDDAVEASGTLQSSGPVVWAAA